LYGTASLLTNRDAFVAVQKDAYDLQKTATTTTSIAAQLSTKYNTQIKGLGDHNFVLFDGTPHPAFNFTKRSGNPNDFIIAEKKGTLPSPDDPNANIPWLQLNQLSGGLGKNVFRVFTVAGVATGTVNISQPATIVTCN